MYFTLHSIFGKYFVRNFTTVEWSYGLRENFSIMTQFLTTAGSNELWQWHCSTCINKHIFFQWKFYSLLVCKWFFSFVFNKNKKNKKSLLGTMRIALVKIFFFWSFSTNLQEIFQKNWALLAVKKYIYRKTSNNVRPLIMSAPLIFGKK